MPVQDGERRRVRPVDGENDDSFRWARRSDRHDSSSRGYENAISSNSGLVIKSRVSCFQVLPAVRVHPKRRTSRCSVGATVPRKHQGEPRRGTAAKGGSDIRVGAGNMELLQVYVAAAAVAALAAVYAAVRRQRRSLPPCDWDSRA
jgi:hypothetical protein